MKGNPNSKGLIGSPGGTIKGSVDDIKVNRFVVMVPHQYDVYTVCIPTPLEIDMTKADILDTYNAYLCSSLRYLRPVFTLENIRIDLDRIEDKDFMLEVYSIDEWFANNRQGNS